MNGSPQTITASLRGNGQPAPPDNSSLDILLTAVEVARYLKLSKSKVYYLISTKRIPHIKIGKNVRVRRADLEAWLEANTQQAIL